MLISSLDEDFDGIMRDMKSFTSKELEMAIEAHIYKKAHGSGCAGS